MKKYKLNGYDDLQIGDTIVTTKGTYFVISFEHAKSFMLNTLNMNCIEVSQFLSDPNKFYGITHFPVNGICSWDRETGLGDKTIIDVISTIPGDIALAIEYSTRYLCAELSTGVKCVTLASPFGNFIIGQNGFLQGCSKKKLNLVCYPNLTNDLFKYKAMALMMYLGYIKSEDNDPPNEPKNRGLKTVVRLVK